MLNTALDPLGRPSVRAIIPIAILILGANALGPGHDQVSGTLVRVDRDAIVHVVRDLLEGFNEAGDAKLLRELRRLESRIGSHAASHSCCVVMEQRVGHSCRPVGISSGRGRSGARLARPNAPRARPVIRRR